MMKEKNANARMRRGALRAARALPKVCVLFYSSLAETCQYFRSRLRN